MSVALDATTCHLPRGSLETLFILQSDCRMRSVARPQSATRNMQSSAQLCRDLLHSEQRGLASVT